MDLGGGAVARWDKFYQKGTYGPNTNGLWFYASIF